MCYKPSAAELWQKANLSSREEFDVLNKMISTRLPPRNPFIIKREDTDRVGQEESGKKVNDSKTDQRVEGDWQLLMNDAQQFPPSLGFPS